MMRAPESPADAGLRGCYDACVHITKTRARNFYFAFLTLPTDARRAICAVYAYCRLLDDIADGPLPTAEKRTALDRVQGQLQASLIEGSDDPVFAAVADTVARYGVRVENLLEVLQGVRQDLDVSRYETFSDLYRYCYLVASSVGLACLEIFRYDREEAREAAVDLGIAMQLTNVVRDVAEDAAAGRIYLPKEDLERFNVTEDMLLAARLTPDVSRLLQFETERAKSYYAKARRLFRHLPRRSRPCPMVLYGVYRELLSQIERTGFDVFSGEAKLSGAQRAHIAFSVGLKGLLWKPPS